MTNRADTNSKSNHHPLPPRDDRETLSALFDGELPGDAMRFAMKRLDHDAEWRDTCGRWQMIGDALRGEAMRAAPTGFASGVMGVLAAEEQEVAAVSSAAPAKARSAAGVRRRWIGGAALAASVAVAAVLAVRPFPDASVAGAEGQVASGVSTPASSAPPAVPATDVPPPVSPPATRPETTAVATAVPSPATDRSAARAVRDSTRPDRGRVPAAQAPLSAEPATAVAAAAPATTTSPFHPPADDIVTRPWPRSVLSDGSAGALTVGMGSSSAATPSLYPFEPRLPDSQPTRSQPPAEPQR